MKPVRIQRKRTKGYKMPENTVYVGRPSIFGNPYVIGKYSPRLNRICETKEDAVAAFEERVMASSTLKRLIKEQLKGKNLACWCKEGQPCHADILLLIANS